MLYLMIALTLLPTVKASTLKLKAKLPQEKTINKVGVNSWLLSLSHMVKCILGVYQIEQLTHICVPFYRKRTLQRRETFWNTFK